MNQTISFIDLQELKINPFTLNDNDNEDKTGLYNNYEINNINDKCNYYCSDTFNARAKHLNNSNLSLIHFNSRSLTKNLDSITDYLITLNHKFPLIAFSESWLNDNNTLTPLTKIDGYTIAHYNRNDKRGGGVALYIANDLNFKVRHDLNLTPSEDYESIFIEIESHPKNTIVGVIYRPPDKCAYPFITNHHQISQQGKPTNNHMWRFQP